MDLFRNMHIFVLIVPQLFVIANAFHFEEDTLSAKCTQAGPDYWCQSYNTVLECNAVEKCSNLFRQSTAVPFDQSQCSFGASFWCQNLENAVRCGQQAVQQCAGGQQCNTPTPGSDPCLSGPSYWCQSPTIALACGSGAFDYCKNQNQEQNSVPSLGADQCTWGPSHICTTFQLAAKCGATFTLCNRQYGSSPGLGSSIKTG